MDLVASWEKDLDGRSTVILKTDIITATAVTDLMAILKGPGPWHHGQYLGQGHSRIMDVANGSSKLSEHLHVLVLG